MNSSFPYPTFSVVLETENLSVADLEELTRCLDTLKAQDLPPEKANEFLLVESGDVPLDRLREIERSHPWISTLKVRPGTDYYEAKMEGARRVSGDVVIFCDSDCQFENSWLRNLVGSFQDPDVYIVGGETALRVDGPYSLALALAWTFPPHSRRRDLYRSSGYACNNVAFRRKFLLENPIPCGLDLYRGNCALHSEECLRKGYATWRQPLSRAVHPLLKREHFLWRILFGAHHMVVVHRLLRESARGRRRRDWLISSFWVAPKIFLRRLVRPAVRLPDLMRGNSRVLVHLPAALLWIAATNLATLAGLGLSLFWPSFYSQKWAINLRSMDSQARSDS